MQHLEALRYWCRDCQRRDLVPNMEHFDMSDLHVTVAKMQRDAENRLLLASDAPKPPLHLKDVSKYRDWAQSFETYLSRLLGLFDVPLSYVIRREALPDPLVAYANDQDELIARAPLRGPNFEADNVRVFDLLKSFVSGGPGWTWMSQFQRTRNGRAAFLALDAHFLGTTQQTALKQEAYRKIERATYNGTKASTFHDYVTIHRQSHNDLALFGEPIPEAKKVRDFLCGIKATHQDIRLAISIVQASNTLSESFEDA